LSHSMQHRSRDDSRSLDQVMLFERPEKFPDVLGRGVQAYAELSTDLLRDLRFLAVLFEEFQYSGAHKVEPIHATVSDVEDDSAVLVMG